MKLARASAAALALATLLSLAPGSPARAGDPAPTGTGPLTVLVRGHATLPADKLEIEFTVMASAEDPTEAERTYQDRLAKVIAAAKGAPGESSKVKKPKDDDKAAPKKPSDDDDDDQPAPKKKAGKKDKDDDKPAEPTKDSKDEVAGPLAVEVSERGLVVSAHGGKTDDNPLQKMMAMQMGGAQAKTDPPVRFSSKVVATIRGLPKIERKVLLRRVAQLLDKVCDAGAEGAESAGAPVVRFLANSGEDVRLAAYEDAVAKAKTRAKTLAGLAERTVRRVASIRESIPPLADAKDSQAAAANVMVQMYGLKASDGGSAASTFELSADVDLEVAFELQP